MIVSDSQAMGRVGEVIIRTWQTAHKMKVQRGALRRRRRAQRQRPRQALRRQVHDQPGASPTASPHDVGSIEAGKLADLVLWQPAFFGVKPELVLKGGLIAWRADGRPQRLDPDAAAGALPADVRRASAGRSAQTCLTFVSQAPLEGGIAERSACAGGWSPVASTPRASARRDMVRNDATPRHRGRPGDVRGPGRRRAARPATPATVLPMAQRYFLF